MGAFQNASIIEQQKLMIERLKDFIFRQHNQLELTDIEDAFLVSNIVAERKDQWQPNS